MANGLLQAGRPEVCFAVLPLGSADDYAYSLKRDRERPPPASLGISSWMWVSSGPIGATIASASLLGLGFGPCVTIESREVGWLQGQLLYGFAVLCVMPASTWDTST